MLYKTLISLVLTIMGWCSVIAQVDNQITVINEATINSADLEFSPAFYEDGIVFISTREAGSNTVGKDYRANENNFSIFWGQRDINGILKAPVPFSKEINTRFNEGPLTFNSTQNVIYFCRTVIQDGKDVEAPDGVSRMNIYQATKSGDDWTNITSLPFNDINYDYVHPSISVNNEVIYFSSNRPGGLGGMDLYVTQKRGETWSEPVNLGPKVNTPGHETFPFIHPDGTLFFTSDTRPGSGGFDLFFVKTSGNGVTGNAVNLGESINTSSDDFGLIVDLDKKNGYFSSNRIEGKGKDDIYSFHTSGKLGETDPDGPSLVEANMFFADKVSGEELEGVKLVYYKMDELTDTEIITDAEGNVTKIGTQNGELVVNNVDGQVGYSNEDGQINMTLERTRYLFIITKDGYQSKQVVRTIGEEDNEFLILLDKTGNTIALKGLVMNEIYKSPLPGATITITDDETQATEMLTSDLDGKFEYNLTCNVPYTVSVTKKGFNTVSRQLRVTDCEVRELVETFDLYGFSQSLAEGNIIRLPNIYYNFNDAGIRPDARRDLDALSALLNQYTDIQIELLSHTDSRGTGEYNINLSQLRAENAKEYVVSKGVDPSRIESKGYGEGSLKNDCRDNIPCDELAHQINRRTEVRILKSPTGINVEYLNNTPEVVHTREDYLRHLQASRVDEQSGKTVTEATDVPAGKVYLVVAGTFKSGDNAASQLSKVLDLGYTDAEIIQYSGNNLHGVVIKRFTDFYEAKTFADNVHSKTRIDTFVKPYNE